MLKRFFHLPHSIQNDYENLNLYEAQKLKWELNERSYKEDSSRFLREKEAWCSKDSSSEKHAVIMCAGDLMCEPAMSEAVFFKNHYCFESCFKYVKPVLATSDFAIANLETMVCEQAPYAHECHRIDGRYHCNAPTEYLDALRYAGFDAFALANNHNADVGVTGLFETLRHIDAKNFMRTGMFLGREEPRFLLARIHTICLAVFSYTMHINRDLDKTLFTETGRNELLNRYSEEKVLQDITAAKKAGAEFLLCYIHFIGKEYSHEVTDNQRKTASFLAEAGMDCIMGSHTHALQTHDIIITEDGRNVPVIYSLGNFITSDKTSMVTRTNIIYRFELKKQNDHVVLSKESYVPCRVVEHTLRSGFVIFPTQNKWHKGYSSQLLEEAQKEISQIIGPSLTMEGELSISPELPFAEARQLTLKKICLLLDISVPSKLKWLENEYIDYITARFTWVRKGCIYFSRYLGATEKEEAYKAFQRGAKIIFSSKQMYSPDGSELPCVIVNDPAQSFYQVNRWLRHLYAAKVIAITGSVGKTTTKEMLHHVISNSFNTLKNIGNANTYAAISDTVQKLKPEHEVYIQEVCAFSPGWVQGGGFMLNPDACLITNIGYPHIDLYGSIENILKDKLSLTQNLTADGVAFLNYDDERLAAAPVNCPVISFAISNQRANYTASDIIYGDGVIHFNINSKNEEMIPACIHMYGEHNVLNALAAFAIGRWLNISAQDIVTALETYRSEGMRQNVCNIGGYHLYMDCYNSAPNSVIGSVHTLARMTPKKGGKKIVVFGDIPRLGKLSEEAHKKVGTDLAAEDIDLYLFYGPYSIHTAEMLKQAGHTVRHTTERSILNLWLTELTSREDIILFKAGHPMALAKTVDQVFGTSFHITDGDVLLENSHFLTHEWFKARWIDGVVEIQAGKKLMSNLTIPEVIQGTTVGRIGKEAFQNMNIKTLMLPQSLYNIGFAAFYKCRQLQSISFSRGLKVIERSAFNECVMLKELVLPESLIEIGERAFCNCTSLLRITIPNSVGHIAKDAFMGCSSLTILCHENSYACAYAKTMQIAFEILL
ncbi:MAG: leucine-rich repeat protein [Lachnospiraceae bacterium]|nr:leucine-rich repeat protein [Lachnospiraceae bacterium]